MPLFRKINPTLNSKLGIILGDRDVVEEDDGDGEGHGEDPGASHQPLSSSPFDH